MELYRYKAVDADGRLQRGQADAVNPIDLEMRLTRLGLDLVSYRPLKSGGLFAARSGIKRPDLITFCFHMEQLLEAGVPMIDALTDLRDSLENRRLQEITAAMIESIQGGKALSEAMRDFPYVFNTVFVNRVRAGEQSGTLTRVLRHMIDNLKWQDEQAAHTKRLFIYPVVVAVVVGGAMFSLMVFVVPELLKFVESMGQELPLHTRILIAVSGAFAALARGDEEPPEGYPADQWQFLRYEFERIVKERVEAVLEPEISRLDPSCGVEPVSPRGCVVEVVQPMVDTPLLEIGAGPYGLSTAAFALEHGLETVTVGHPAEAVVLERHS